MPIMRPMLSLIFITVTCLPAGLSAKDVPGNTPEKVQELVNSKPPVETPAGTSPAEPANPGQNPTKTAAPSNPETPSEPSKPADPLKNGNPVEETPSGTKPADPANPGENPATPAETDDKAKPDKTDKDKKDKADKDPKERKDNSGKGGKGGPSLPSGGAPPQGGGASLAPAAGGIGGLVGGVLSGGKNEEKKEEKKTKPPKFPLKETAASSETIKAGEAVRSSTQAIPAEALYSSGKGPRIAVVNFEGENGAEFSALLSAALASDLKVYDPKELVVKKIDSAAINRVSARMLAADLDIEYLVAGKINRKTATLSIISVFLRDGVTGDIKMTDNHNIRSAEDIKSAAENAAGKIRERITP